MSKGLTRPIYLDYNATTPVDPRVISKMLPFFNEAFGNAASVTHAFGWEASQAVEVARKEAAVTIGAQPKEVFWTSGATESNNMAILGITRSYKKRGLPVHLVTSEVEHKAVCDVMAACAKEGAEVTFLKPDQFGRVLPEMVEGALRKDTRLVSIIMGQNEIGTINPIAAIGALLRPKGILFHTDCAQTLGKVAVNVREMNIDLLSGSGHKIYGPKGIGLLYIRATTPPIELEPIQFGGAQEKKLRPGTLNVPAIVGFGEALKIAREEMAEETKRLTSLRDTFIKEVMDSVPGVQLNGHPTERLSSNISLTFEDLSSDVFALGLSGLAVSSGSACSMGAPSYVLQAIGLPEALARSTVRFGIGRFTKEEDLKIAAQKIRDMVARNREQSLG